MCRDELVIYTGSIIGGLLVDGLGDGVLIDAPHEDLEFVASTSFGLLQVRMCGYSLKQVGAYVWVLPLAGGFVCVGIASGRGVRMCGYSLKQGGAYVWV